MRTRFGLRTEALFRTLYAALEEGISVVGPTQIAESLGVSKSTAYKLLNELSQAGYGQYVPKKGLILNEEGRKEAKMAVRMHRLIECMLDDIGVEEFCGEAERIEMVAGKSFIEAIEAKYGDRKICPCGKKIPEVNK
ncbi:metal-dependent transcriptional regulator [Archaeoglobus neptunius]|uniref:metal-dependent transcriptional regulator n=1 Tax=Archaeoglobus neptunius TaxID=2798580 RepID=UPI002EDADBA3